MTEPARPAPATRPTEPAGQLVAARRVGQTERVGQTNSVFEVRFDGRGGFEVDPSA